MRIPSFARAGDLVRMKIRTFLPPRVLAIGTLALTVSTGCATAGPAASPGSNAGAASVPTPSVPSSSRPALATRWPVRTSAHVDLWLHAFATIDDQSLLVPLYRRGYRDSIATVKNRANVLTSLDANRATLARRLTVSPGYLQAQFLPFDFSSWEEMRIAAERFLQFEGDPRRASDQQTAARIAQYAAIFPAAEDREWLRLFIAGVQDEQVRWFGGEHARVLRARARVTNAVDSMWNNSYRTKFERFLNNTSQRAGDFLLSLPIGGEGRAGSGRERQTVVAVTWPGRVEDAREAILVFAHEVTGTIVGGVVADNTTPAQKRDGSGERFVAAGQVRAGAMVLERVAPELLEPYQKFYLAQSGIRSDGGVAAAFLRTYAIPGAIVDGLQKQIEIILGGI